MSRTSRAIGWMFAAALAAMVAILAISMKAENLLPGLEYRDVPKAALNVATALFVITLFVERSMAVINALISGGQQRQADLEFSFAESVEAKKEAALKVAEVLGAKERLRLLGAFAAGLYVSAAGVRTLGGLLDPAKLAPNCPPANVELFNGVDIVLTAGLIAGGSNALAILIQIIKDFFAKTPPEEAQLRARLTTSS